MAAPYQFCPYCATALTTRYVHGRWRQACPACGFVHWRNPVVGVAVIVTEKGQVLLARRARGPYRGAWCIPCGYVEHGEDVRAAAQREFQEETGLLVHVGDLYAVHANFHDPAQHTVGLWFRGTVLGGTLRPGDDVDQVAYVPLHRLPEPLAFPTDRLVLARLRQEEGQA
ncbi:MAG: hypothetical protein KatS3mg131_3822 [Candidatus Tectimicrobiota bacterium]|nr:MAG: hypothetical protein KatS3mg131_3822 [Candidatus Tectomicrobia bacterium]